ncbi:hypothetical protein WJX74_003031 [Apatococcus lobatus]|uniref:Uncharacterized protein n=1 Tax=Apatococcus lobatus TaxID=904363 RepID=A0AAW1SAI8_9CHLO
MARGKRGVPKKSAVVHSTDGGQEGAEQPHETREAGKQHTAEAMNASAGFQLEENQALWQPIGGHSCFDEQQMQSVSMLVNGAGNPITSASPRTPMMICREKDQSDPFWTASLASVLAKLQGKVVMACLIANAVRMRFTKLHTIPAEALPSPPACIASSPSSSYLWIELLNIWTSSSPINLLTPAVVLYSAQVSAGSAAALLCHLRPCLPSSYVPAGIVGIASAYFARYMEHDEPFVKWVGRIIGLFIFREQMTAIHSACALCQLFTLEAHGPGLPFLQACMADLTVSMMHSFHSLLEIHKIPMLRPVVPDQKSLSDAFGLGTTFRKNLQKLRRKQVEAALSLSESVSQGGTPHSAAPELPAETMLAPQLPADPPSMALQSGSQSSVPAQLPAAAAHKTGLAQAEHFVRQQAVLPGVSGELEMVLRHLLVEPFTEQAVSLMGQRRSSALSLSEQKSAISRTVDETTAWAVSELKRLQAKKQPFVAAAGVECAGKHQAATNAAADAAGSSVAAEVSHILVSTEAPDAAMDSENSILQQDLPHSFVFKARQPAKQSRMDDTDGSEVENGQGLSRPLGKSQKGTGKSSSSLQSSSGTTKPRSNASEAAQKAEATGDRPSSGQHFEDSQLTVTGSAASLSASHATHSPAGRTISLASHWETRHSELMSFKQRTMPDLAVAQQVCDSLRKKQAAFLKMAMDTLPWNAMSSEIVDITGYYLRIKPARFLAGQPGSVLRRRIGPHAAASCVEELWQESQKRKSPTVALYGNVPASFPTAHSVQQALDRMVDSEECDGGFRTTAVLLVMMSTSAWIMGRLPVSGGQPSKHWLQYAEEDAVHIGAAYKMYHGYHVLLKRWLSESSDSPEIRQVFQECCTSFDKLQPLLATALHTMQPSQMQPRPLQAQRAVSDALRDLAATCHIAAWELARELAFQVDGFYGKETMSTAGWDPKYVSEEPPKWPAAVDKAAQEYCKPQQRALEIQAWLEQADALFSNAIPSNCWDRTESICEDLKGTPADLAAQLQAALEPLSWELDARSKACWAWFTMYAGDKHPEAIHHLYSAYQSAWAQAVKIDSDLAKLRVVKETADTNDLRNRINGAVNELVDRRNRIDAAEAEAVEAVGNTIAQRQVAGPRSISWAVPEPATPDLFGLPSVTKRILPPETKPAAEKLPSKVGDIAQQQSGAVHVPAQSAAATSQITKEAECNQQQADSNTVIERVNKEQWPPVRASLNALRLTPVLQAPMDDYSTRCETYLADFMSLGDNVARLAAAQQPKAVIDIVAEVCKKAEQILGGLAIFDAGVKETLNRAILKERAQPGCITTASFTPMPSPWDQSSHAPRAAGPQQQEATPASSAAQSAAAAARTTAAEAAEQAASAEADPAKAVCATADTSAVTKQQAAPPPGKSDSSAASSTPRHLDHSMSPQQQAGSNLQAAGTFSEPAAAGLEHGLHEGDPPEEGSRAVIKRLNKVLGTMPWGPPSELVRRLVSLQIGPAEVNRLDQTALQSYMREAVDVVGELAVVLHERQSQLQAGLNALKLSPHMQLPLKNCMDNSDSSLRHYRDLQAQMAQLTESGKPDRCIGALVSKGVEVSSIMASLETTENLVQELLSAGLYMEKSRPGFLTAIGATLKSWLNLDPQAVPPELVQTFRSCLTAVMHHSVKQTACAEAATGNKAVVKPSHVSGPESQQPVLSQFQQLAPPSSASWPISGKDASARPKDGLAAIPPVQLPSSASSATPQAGPAGQKAASQPTQGADTAASARDTLAEQQRASRAALRRANQALDMFPFQVPPELMVSIMKAPGEPDRLGCQDANASLQQQLRQKIRLIGNLGKLLHDRKARIQERLVNLKLATHLQALLMYCMAQSDEQLATFRSLEAEVCELVESEDLEDLINDGELHAKCMAFTKPVGTLASLEGTAHRVLIEAVDAETELPGFLAACPESYLTPAQASAQRKKGTSGGLDADAAAAERVRKVLDILPPDITESLLKGAFMLLCPNAPSAGWHDDDPHTQQAIDGKLAVVSELSRKLHERKSKLETAVNALKLAPYLQATVLDCIMAQEVPLFRVRSEQMQVQRIAHRGVSAHGMDALNTASINLKQSVTELAEHEDRLRTILTKALNMEKRKSGFLLGSCDLFEEFLAANPDQLDEEEMAAVRSHTAALQKLFLQLPYQRGTVHSPSTPASSATSQAAEAQPQASPPSATASFPESAAARSSTWEPHMPPAASGPALRQASRNGALLRPQDGSKPAQPTSTPSAQSPDKAGADRKQHMSETILEQMFKAVELFPWQPPSKLAEKIARKLPDRPQKGGGADANASWRGAFAEKDSAFKHLMTLLDARRERIACGIRDVCLDPLDQAQMAILLKDYDKRLEVLQQKRASLHHAVRHRDLEARASTVTRHCVAVGVIVEALPSFERNMHLMVFQRLTKVWAEHDLPETLFDKITDWLLQHQQCIPPEYAERFSATMLMGSQHGLQPSATASKALQPSQPPSQNTVGLLKADGDKEKTSVDGLPEQVTHKETTPQAPSQSATAAKGASIQLFRSVPVPSADPSQTAKQAASAASNKSPKLPERKRKPSGAKVAPAAVSLSADLKSQRKAGPAPAVASSDAAISHSAAGAPNGPAADQPKAQGLAKGFFSRNTGVGVKKPADCSPEAQADAHGPRASAAVNGNNSCIVPSVPASWFAQNRKLDHDMARSLHGFRSRIRSFRSQFSQRASFLQTQVSAWDLLDGCVNYQMDQLEELCDDLEHMVCDLAELQGARASGPDAFALTQDLHQNFRCICVANLRANATVHFERALVMYQMPDDLRGDAIQIDADIAKETCELHDYLGHAVQALCIPDASASGSKTTTAAHAKLTAPGSKIPPNTAASSNTAQDLNMASSNQALGAPADVASTVQLKGKAPVVDTPKAVANSASGNESKPRARNDFAAALQKGMAPKREEASAGQHRPSSTDLAPVLQAQKGIDSTMPPRGSLGHMEADGSVQHADALEDSEPEEEQQNQPPAQEGMSKQRRKRLKRQAQKIKAQMRAEEERQSQEKATEAEPGEEQAPVEGRSSPARSQSPGLSSANPDSRSARTSAEARETSDTQLQTAAPAEASRSQAEEQLPAQAHAEAGHASSAASSTADLYHHGDLGPSSLSDSGTPSSTASGGRQGKKSRASKSPVLPLPPSRHLAMPLAPSSFPSQPASVSPDLNVPNASDRSPQAQRSSKDAASLEASGADFHARELQERSASVVAERLNQAEQRQQQPKLSKKQAKKAAQAARAAASGSAPVAAASAGDVAESAANSMPAGNLHPSRSAPPAPAEVSSYVDRAPAEAADSTAMSSAGPDAVGQKEGRTNLPAASSNPQDSTLSASTASKLTSDGLNAGGSDAKLAPATSIKEVSEVATAGNSLHQSRQGPYHLNSHPHSRHRGDHSTVVQRAPHPHEAQQHKLGDTPRHSQLGSVASTSRHNEEPAQKMRSPGQGEVPVDHRHASEAAHDSHQAALTALGGKVQPRQPNRSLMLPRSHPPVEQSKESLPRPPTSRQVSTPPASLHNKISQDLAAAISSGQAQAVRNLVHAAVRSLSNISFDDHDTVEIRGQILVAKRWLQQPQPAPRAAQAKHVVQPAQSASQQHQQQPSYSSQSPARLDEWVTSAEQHQVGAQQLLDARMDMRPFAGRNLGRALGGPPAATARPRPPGPSVPPAMSVAQQSQGRGALPAARSPYPAIDQARQRSNGSPVPSAPSRSVLQHESYRVNDSMRIPGQRNQQLPPATSTAPATQHLQAQGTLPARAAAARSPSPAAMQAHRAYNGSPVPAALPVPVPPQEPPRMGSPIRVPGLNLQQPMPATSDSQQPLPATSAGLPAWLLANLPGASQPMSASAATPSSLPSASLAVASGPLVSAAQSNPFAAGGLPPQQMSMSSADSPSREQTGLLSQPAVAPAAALSQGSIAQRPQASSTAANPFMAANPFLQPAAPPSGTMWPGSFPQPGSKQASGASTPTQAEDDMCIVCMDSERNAYFGPCTCRVACFPCALKVAAKYQMCPWCGRPITGAYKAEFGI